MSSRTLNPGQAETTWLTIFSALHLRPFSFWVPRAERRPLARPTRKSPTLHTVPAPSTLRPQALARSHDKAVRAFASEMIRDHKAVNDKALALVKALKVIPEDNATSAGLSKDAAATLKRLSRLSGRSFDRAYVANEIAYHKAVNAALAKTLIPSADNRELKALLETGLTLFREHQAHAEHLAARLK